MARKLISSGSTFERIAGYSRALVDGDWIFVSGTTGFDYETMTISADLVEQVHQTFRNIEKALKQAGASLKDVVRAFYIMPKAEDWPDIMPIIGQYFGEIRPTNTAIIAGLVDPRMRIEIEVTARRSKPKSRRQPATPRRRR